MSLRTVYALLYMEINIVSSVLVGLIRYKTNGISRMTEQRNFALSIDTEIVFFMSDALCVMMRYRVLPYIPAAFLAIKSIYFLSSALMCYFWFVYFELMQESEFIRKPKNTLYSSFLVWVMLILLIVNAFTGILFYIDEDGIYRRGSLFLLQYIISYIYVVFTSCRAAIGLFSKNNYSKRKMLAGLALFPLAPAGAGIIQYYYPELPVACAAMAIATLVMYLNWTDRMISVDALTKLSNRKQLTLFYKKWSSGDNDEPMYLLMIDANKFKYINDHYGHLQGDAALIRIASALELSCREFRGKNIIARYGGDEFTVLLNTGDVTEANRIAGRIPVILSELNEQANSPYELTVSIGLAAADKELSLKEVIENADRRMYLEKERLKKQGV